MTSDAVDRAVAQIDFRDLSGETVYLDTQYLKAIKGIGFVNADYITSSLRQQLVAANCLLQEKKEDADFIVEARVGALGTEGHEVTYGMPSNNALSTAASLMPTAPPLPPLPEISFAKKNHQVGASKIAVFAYNRKTKRPLWQSGITKATSTAKDSWVLGIGPFQRGTIYDKTRFAGDDLNLPVLGRRDDDGRHTQVNYEEEFHFQELTGEQAQPQRQADKPNHEPRRLGDRVRRLFRRSRD